MVARRAFVTGATGGLGRSLVPALIARGYDVVAVGRDLEIGKELSKVGSTFVSFDLTTPIDPGLMKGIDVVFHLAALSTPWGHSEAFEAINVTATQSLCHAAREAGVDCFIFTSTPSIYAASGDRLNIKETDPHATPFANHYARTKFEAEQIVLETDGMRRIVVRPRAIVGPDDTVLLPRLAAALKRPFFPLPNQGRALIELTDVRDVVAALILADEQRIAADGQAFNISGGEPMELRQILQNLVNALKLETKTVPVPAVIMGLMSHVLQFGARLWPGQPEPPLTPYIVKTLAFSQTFDLSRARGVLGWSPNYTPQEAIQAALEGSRR